MLEAHLLPVAMRRNQGLHFISKFHHLKVENNDNRFLRMLEKETVVSIPVAHAEGNYFIDSDGLAELEANGQVLLRYCDENGDDANPNGSVGAIAGICNKEKNVFGLMPHPERAVDALIGSDDGILMLKGLIA